MDFVSFMAGAAVGVHLGLLAMFIYFMLPIWIARALTRHLAKSARNHVSSAPPGGGKHGL